MENGKRADTDVLIVGAGPVGLTMANILSHYGVNYRIIDRASGPTDESRALWVQPRTIEYWAKIGLAEEATAEGHTSTEIYPLVNGKKYGAVSFGGTGEDRTPYNFALILEQSKSERLLLRGLKRYGVEVEWDTELLDLDETEAGATATVQYPDGSEGEISASWVVEAGGVNSRVRDILGLTFEGKTYERGFFVADVDMEWPYGHEHIFPEFTDNAFLGYFPMPGGEKHFRIVSTLTPELAAQRDRSEEADLDDIRDAMKTLSGVDIKLTDARWISVYTVQQKMANYFRSTGPGRVFIAGDAAHTHSPSGGQGMNTGLGDAFNLGWKLALVIKGEAKPELLDSYEAERLPTARTILDKSDNLFNFQVTNKPLLDKIKVSILPAVVALATRSKWANRQFFDFTAQIDITYDESPAVEQAQEAPRKGPKAGDRAPYGLFHDGTDLYELLLGPEHHLLFFEGTNSNFARLDVARKEIERLLDNYRPSFSIHRIPKENRELHQRYSAEKPSLFLIRPDGHIAYSGEGTDLVGLKMYLDRLFARQETAGQPREEKEMSEKIENTKQESRETNANGWRLGPENSEIGFSAGYGFFLTARGSFTNWRGELLLDEEELGRSSVDVEIDSASVSTGIGMRDFHLRTPHFLGVKQFPTIRFVSKRVEAVSEDRVKVIGDLTIRDITREVVLDAERARQESGRQSWSATTTLDRYDYGVAMSKLMEGYGKMVANNIEIEIRVDAKTP